jgi:hypothetical protein
MTSGRLDVQSHIIGCRLQLGHTVIDSAIETEALLDLAYYHTLGDRTTLEAFSLLIPEIERLATAKCRMGRWEQDGSLLIGRLDLVRYGFARKSTKLEIVNDRLELAAE